MSKKKTKSKTGLYGRHCPECGEKNLTLTHNKVKGGDGSFIATDYVECKVCGWRDIPKKKKAKVREIQEEY